MTVAFMFAEKILNGLTALNGFDLPLTLISKVRRVLKNFKSETEDLFKDREKILTKLCTLDQEKGMWIFPKQGEENFDEFVLRWEELQGHDIIFPYEPIDYLGIIDNTPEEIKKKIVAKGSDFDVIESLNETYVAQFEKKADPPATVVSDKGPESPKANA